MNREMNRFHKLKSPILILIATIASRTEIEKRDKDRRNKTTTFGAEKGYSQNETIV